MSESTVRRWCDRRLIPTSRTSGGHRRIGLADLLAFARQEKLTIHGAPTADAEPNTDELSRRLYSHFEAGDALAVRRLLTETATRALRPAVVCDEIIAPAMHRIGTAWEAGTLDVFQEHAASVAVESSLSALRDLVGRPSPADPRAICCALADDPYSIGPAMAGLVLLGEGYAMTQLGANTPAAEVVRAAEHFGPAIVAISVGAVRDDDSFVADLNMIARELERLKVRLAIGGAGLTVELRKRIRADFFGDSMGHLASFARNTRRFQNGTNAPTPA